ncbi:hypothetical protein O181_036567 [Austropuccinia psidii MF-1]|uniref:Uncharacterized protein n=1 Tax=Austropuccinia psidii MF-1 TaxID=1389203 RepID=A0A9Q3D7B9_9BASI|nr:hypothetical protein [Austropuccinia psidii MF-1]
MCTCPDLSYTVNVLAQHSMSPTASHWAVLDHLVSHLSKTRDACVSLASFSTNLHLWVDSSWGGDYEKSQTGFLITLRCTPIAWGSKPQTVVALSTCTTECLALCESTQHLTSWVKCQ